MTPHGVPDVAEPGGRIAVLHVDDDPRTTDLTRHRLEAVSDRIVVTESNDPVAAFESFDTDAYDCILSDYRMPNIDGLELLAAVRDRDRHFPFIFFTGRGSESIASEAIAAGVTDYVQKGRGAETYEMLANRIENAVEGHRVRTALTESERRFREVTEHIGEVVWMADADFASTIYVNPAYERVWGRPVDELDGDPAVFLDGIHPDDRDLVRSAFEDPADGYEVVYRVRRPDGSIRWVEDRGVPIRDDDGTIRRTVGVAKDITRYKEAVREHELLLARITDGFVSVDADDRLTYVNERAAELLDADPAEVVGTSLWEVVPDAAETPFAAAHAEAVETGESRTVEAFIDPLDRWLTAHIYPSDDGVSSIVRDVTDRHERERRLEAIFENTYQFTGLMTLEGRLLEVNDSVPSDADRDSLVGSNVIEAFDVTDETAARIETGLERARSGHFFRTEIAYTAGGERRVADFSIRPIEDGGGSVVELLAEARDVTKRKRREELLEGLTTISKDILRASTSLEIYEIAVAAATDVFDRPTATSYALRSDRNHLEPVASWTDSGAGTRFESGDDLESAGWQAFAEQSVRYDPGPSPNAPETAGEIGTNATESAAVDATGSAAFVPLSDHGVLVVRDAREDAFSTIEIDLLELLGTMVAAALDRVSGHSVLRERERELERVSDDVSRLQLYSHLTRETVRAISAADTRSDLERSVCEFLTTLDVFEGAWIGSMDPADGTVEPTVWRGIPDAYFDGGNGSLADRHRALLERAIETGAVQVVDDVLETVPDPTVRREALRYGCHTVAAAPFRAETIVGAVLVYGRPPGVYADETVSILREVGAVVGQTIQSIERSRARISDTELTVELSLTDDAAFYQRLAASAGGTLDLQGAAASDGRFTQFVSLAPTNTAGVTDAAGEAENRRAITEGESTDASRLESLAGVNASIEVLASNDERVLARLETTDETIVEPLYEVGGTLRSLSASADRVTIQATLPHGTDVRSFVEAYRRRYETVDLVARTETERRDDRPSVLTTAAMERLTDRQREALLLAYHAGYFESPRETTGQELADLMDVASPTFHNHLRSAQARLFEAFLETAGSP